MGVGGWGLGIGDDSGDWRLATIVAIGDGRLTMIVAIDDWRLAIGNESAIGRSAVLR